MATHESQSPQQEETMAPPESITSTSLPSPSRKSQGLDSNTPSTAPSSSDGTSPVVVSTTTPASAAQSSSTTSSLAQTSAHNPAQIPISTASSAISSATTSTQGNLQISPGALAGAIVGPAVAASLLTLAVTLLFIRQSAMKKKRRHRRATPVGKARYNGTVPTESNKWQQHLPQPVDDQIVKSNVRTLMDQLNAHVANFYGNQQRSTEISHDSLQALDDTVPSLGLPLRALLSQSPCPTDLIKRYLAGMLVHSDFLPPAVSNLQQSFCVSSDSAHSHNVVTQAWGQWRILTTYLQPNLRKDRTFLQQRQVAIDAAAERFVQAFWPWCVRDSDRQTHLVALLERAAELALLLFAQPYAYTWQWAGTAEEFVMLPGLLRVSDDEGMPLSVPTTLVRSTVAPMSWRGRL